jgi:hypothetical protein
VFEKSILFSYRSKLVSFHRVPEKIVDCTELVVGGESVFSYCTEIRVHLSSLEEVQVLIIHHIVNEFCGVSVWLPFLRPRFKFISL